MALVTVSEIKTYLGISGSSEDTLLGVLADYASSAIEKYCNRKFISTAVVERVNGGGRHLCLSNWPIISLTSIIDKHDSDSVIDSGDYELDADAGLIDLSYNSGLTSLYPQSRWNPGYRRYQVSYTAGYSTIPNDVKLAACLFVGQLRSNRTSGYQSETIGDYSYSLATGNEPTMHSIRTILGHYRSLML